MHFIASTVEVERDEVDSLDSEVVHPDADEVESELSQIKLIQRKPMGLGELIAAHQGRGRPPRGKHSTTKTDQGNDIPGIQNESLSFL